MTTKLEPRLLHGLWLWMVVLLLGVFSTVQAQTKDVITFAGGHVDPDNENIYVIDLAPENWIDDDDLISVDTVTPSIGQETTRNTIIATLVAIALMLVYITFRFEFFFGLSAVIALVHDITLVIGLYALFQIQVNSPFIAAILTILGYSINDTIVVFDRIRENEAEMGFTG